MSFSKNLHDILPLVDGALSIEEITRYGCLQPVLSVETISKIWAPNSPKLQKAFVIWVKSAIRNNELDALTVEEFSKHMTKWELSRKPEKFIEPRAPGTLPPVFGNLIAHGSTNIVPGQEALDESKKKMYVVHKDSMKEWLIKEGEWPLPSANLLSYWWSESDQETLPTKSVEREEIAADENIFRLTGDKFIVQFNGNTSYYNNLKGMRYISILLQTPGKEFHAQELQNSLHFLDVKEIIGSGGVTSDKEWTSLKDQMNLSGVSEDYIIDEQAIRNIKIRIDELDNLIKGCDDKSDYLNKIKYEEDREKLKEEVKKAIGRSGIRSIVDDAEKARKAVSNAIRHALEKIERDNVTLAKHLRSSIKMGEYCLYNPEHEIDWKL